MRTKKTTGIILCIIGLVCLGMSYYIKNQVAGGKAQIEAAQQTVNQTNKAFSANPVSKQVGNFVTGGAQSQIDAGTAKVIFYARVAQILQIGGIILIIVGIVMLFLPRRSSR